METLENEMQAEFIEFVWKIEQTIWIQSHIAPHKYQFEHLFSSIFQ